MSLQVETIGNAKLYCGDCREILPTLTGGDAVVTDPVWPNVPRLMTLDGKQQFPLAGADRPFELLAEAMGALPESVRRIVLHLGCNSDPRILRAVPDRFSFIRTCWLEYAVPHFTGRVLNGADTAYAFGRPVKRVKGRRVIPGRAPKSQPQTTCREHPCTRSLPFVEWLVWWFSDPSEVVVDPFMGSGTTGIGALNLDRGFVGIEVEARWFDLACRRIEESLRQQRFDLATGDDA